MPMWQNFAKSGHTAVDPSGQSYKHFMLVNYDSMVRNMVYFPVRYDSRVVIYKRKMFIRLATEKVSAV